MANPQKENGYTPIANEVLEALYRAELSGQEFQMSLMIIRQTWGFRQKEKALPLSAMGLELGWPKSRCSQIANLLRSRKIITVAAERFTGSPVEPKRYRFNKDYEQWESRKTDTVSEIRDGSSVTTDTVAENRDGRIRKPRPLYNGVKETLKERIKETPPTPSSKINGRIGEWLRASRHFSRLSPEYVTTLLTEYAEDRVLKFLQGAERTAIAKGLDIKKPESWLDKYIENVERSDKQAPKTYSPENWNDIPVEERNSHFYKEFK